MGCGSSRVNVIDDEAIDDADSVQKNSGNGIKTSTIDEREEKTVQFSTDPQSNGVAPNEGEIKLSKTPKM